MDPNPIAFKEAGEISKAENKTSADVILAISEDETAPMHPHPYALKDQWPEPAADSPLRISNDSSASPEEKTVPARFPFPENDGYPNRPPLIPTTNILTRRRYKARYLKPKSRFGEQSILVENNLHHERSFTVQEEEDSKTGLKEIATAEPITTKKPSVEPSGDFGRVEELEEREIYKKVNIRKRLRFNRSKMKVLIEWFVFLCILGGFIASLTVEKLKVYRIWSLEVWKWCALVLLTFSAMLFTQWLVLMAVLLIELNFLLKKKVIYFVYALRKSVLICIWWSLVLVTWVLLFRKGVKLSGHENKILDRVTWTIVTFLIGSVLWLIKTLLLKSLASSFHVQAYFDRIQQSVFLQYVLTTLSGHPIIESDARTQFSYKTTKIGKGGKEKKRKEEIDVQNLQKLKREKVTAWTMKMLVDMISNSRLTTISGAFGDDVSDGGNEQSDWEITNEEEAIATAYHIFRNVARPGSQYINETDLRRFMIKEEVDYVFPMIDVAETGQIDKKALIEWVIKVYNGRKALAHALNDTKTAVKHLDKLVRAVLIIIMVIVWLLLMDIATTKILLFMSSQLLVAAFIFGNTCKTIFEAIIFVFVMHPFDVGDRCVVDGVQMIVEEMKILTTVFLRYDNEKIYYPNSVLASKPITNFQRSPDMSDAFEFSIDFKTPLRSIGTLKQEIKKYIENNPMYWHQKHDVVVKEVVNMNKICMAVYFCHTMNFHDYGERNRRRSELVLEMKKIFEELNIKYDLLPQEVHLVESLSREMTIGTCR